MQGSARPGSAQAVDGQDLARSPFSGSRRIPDADARRYVMTDDEFATTTTPRESRLAFSPDEVAAALGVSRELVNDLIRTGQLGSVKAGRRRLISRKHLEEFLDGDAA